MRIKEMLHLKNGDRIVKTREKCCDENGLGTTKAYKGKQEVLTVLNKTRKNIYFSGKKIISNNDVIYFYEIYKGKK